MQGENQYLSKKDFAVSQGWSPSYVTKLKEQGRLVLSPDGKRVNVQATLEKLNRTSDPSKNHVKELHAAARTERDVGKHIRPDAPSVGEESGSSDPKYWDNKTRREGALAALAELELAKKAGVLVERDRVQMVAFAAGRMLRDAVLNIPTQIAPVLAAMTDPWEVERALRDALRQVMTDMDKVTADDLDKAMEASH